KRLTRNARTTTAPAMRTNVQREASCTRTALTPTSAGAEAICRANVSGSPSGVNDRPEEIARRPADGGRGGVEIAVARGERGQRVHLEEPRLPVGRHPEVRAAEALDPERREGEARRPREALRVDRGGDDRADGLRRSVLLRVIEDRVGPRLRVCVADRREQ